VKFNIQTLIDKLRPQLPKEPGGSRLMHTPNPTTVILRKKNAAKHINDQLFNMNK
jgi:hypothetical protein